MRFSLILLEVYRVPRISELMLFTNFGESVEVVFFSLSPCLSLLSLSDPVTLVMPDAVPGCRGLSSPFSRFHG